MDLELDYVLVAVRMKSSRLPLKALLDVEGVPLLERLVNRLVETMPISNVILCTSTHEQDQAIEDFANEKNFRCFRGSELDVMGRFLGAAEQVGAETVARVTGDNPLTDPVHLVEMFAQHRRDGAEYTFTDELPVGTRAEVISVSALKRIHRQLSDPSSSEYMTYMLRRPDKVIQGEYKLREGSGLNRPEISLTVDSPEDMESIRAVYGAFKGRDLPPLLEIVKWLDKNPEYRIDLEPAAADPAALVGIDISYSDD